MKFDLDGAKEVDLYCSCQADAVAETSEVAQPQRRGFNDIC